MLQKSNLRLTIPIYGDNLATLKFGRELAVTSKLKHLGAAYHISHESDRTAYSGNIGNCLTLI